VSKTVNDDNKQGFFWHIHDRVLIEWCLSYDESIEGIRVEPLYEQETRLRLFQPVKGSLPEEVIKAGQVYNEAWQTHVEALRALDEARQARNEARQALDKAWLFRRKVRRAYDEARRACDETLQVRSNKAWETFDKAEQAYVEALTKNMPAIEALHAEECPNCPWNGHTIFPNA